MSPQPSRHADMMLLVGGLILIAAYIVIRFAR